MYKCQNTWICQNHLCAKELDFASSLGEFVVGDTSIKLLFEKKTPTTNKYIIRYNNANIKQVN